MIIERGSIGYFCRYGDFFTSTDIFEEGPSFGSAVAGALIGGGVGALIASKGKITSTTRVHDKRETILMLNEDGHEKYLFFDPNLYNILMHQIPNKEISYISNLKQQRVGDDLVEKLAKLGELNEKGYINNDEFNQLKSELLKSPVLSKT